MSELEDIRQKRLKQLMQQQTQDQVQSQYAEQMKEQEVNAQIQLIVNKLMEPEARERLSNIRLVKPEFARQVEILLIQMYQSGRLGNKLDDPTFKTLLEKLASSGKRESKITRR